MLARRPLDIFNDLLARASARSSCLSHVPLLSGYDEPRNLSYQIRLFGPISPDVRQYGSEIKTNEVSLYKARGRNHYEATWRA